jgi:predicted Zn-dependent protease
VGLELAARAGYDPRAGISLWKKMSAASKGAPPQWMSTHPAGVNRIAEIERSLPKVMPLYERSKR